MAIKFNFIVSEKEVLEKWAEQTSVENWINMYEKLSDSFGTWNVDLELAEFIIKRVKKGYIDKYRDDDIPDVLRPLLINAISDNLEQSNKENKDLTLEDVSGIAELEAIKTLREYSSLDYNDGVNLFCEGYDLAKEEQGSGVIDLSEVSKEDLLRELSNRF